MSQQVLSKFRLRRLKQIDARLGEPDLFSITKITTVHGFLSQRKTVSIEEYFVAGLNFSTTAHVSTYINDAILQTKKQGNHQAVYKIKLFMYDAFQQRDLVIDVNIPGSLELKGFNLSGQPIKVSDEDYKCAYYSSFLRSLFTHTYHSSMRIYSEIQKNSVLASIIPEFIPFVSKNLIRCQIEESQPCYDYSQQEYNLSIELFIKYIFQNSLWNLLPIFQKQLKKCCPVRSTLLEMEIMTLKGQHEEILLATADYFLQEEDHQLCLSKKFKEYQLRSLIKLKKFSQARFLREMLIREGFLNEIAWGELLLSSMQQGETNDFLKLLNTCSSYFLEEEPFEQKLKKVIYPEPLSHDWNTKKSQKLSFYPEFCHDFDNKFLEEHSHIKTYRHSLQKSQKQKPTLEILQKLDDALNNKSILQPYLIAFEKSKNWNTLMEIRNVCFWLESDFVLYENSIQKNSSMNKSYRFMNQQFMTQSQVKGTSNLQQMSLKKMDDEENIEEYFEGMSDSDEEDYQQMQSLAPCSKRIPTKRGNHQMATKRKFESSKILCHFSLQKIFGNVYNLLQLQTDCDAWASKLNFEDVGQMSKDKRELISIILIKKAWLHKKLHRYRKSEQSFKLVRKCTNNVLIGIVSCYQLAILYLEHRNLKGVQFYIVELVRLLLALGIDKYDTIPKWAKKILPFITRSHQGEDLTNVLDGPFKQIVKMWEKLSLQSSKSPRMRKKSSDKEQGRSGSVSSKQTKKEAKKGEKGGS